MTAVIEQHRATRRLLAHAECRLRGLAHDINNALAVISTSIDLIEDDCSDDSPHRALLLDMRTAVDYGAGLARQCLASHAARTGPASMLRLNDALIETTSLLRRITGDTIAFAIAPEEPSGHVHLTATELTQVLMNLVGNSRDAMPHGGRLTVATTLVSNHGRRGTPPPDLATGPYAILTVSDTGTGMDAETLERIFDPLFTTKAPGVGTGLGLTIVRRIVSAHGGAISVRSVAGAGTTFSVFLPAVEAGSGTQVQGTAARMAVHGSTTAGTS